MSANITGKLPPFQRKYKHDVRTYKREYASYYSMRQRCYNTKKDNYYEYGGRGIIVCDRWLDSFDNFIEDMGIRPKGTTLDRINSKGNYEPSNCRWATYKEQTLNTTTIKWIYEDDKKLCISDFAKKYNVSPSAIGYRVRRNLSIEDLKLPAQKLPKVEVIFKGVSYRFRELKREFEFSENTYRRRVRSGISHEDALCEVFKKKGIQCVASDFKYNILGWIGEK